MNRLYNKRIRQCLLFIQLVLLYLPSLALFSIPTDNGPIPASLCYFFSLVFAPYLILHLKKLKWPPIFISGFFLYVILLAVLRAGSYGISKSILHWLFGLYLLMVVVNLGADFTGEEWEEILGRAACVFAVLHCGYLMIFQHDTVLYLLQGFFNGTITGWDGDKLLSLTRGGRNLDATWLGLGIFFVRGRKKLPYMTYTILFAFLGCSRVGVIAAGLAMLWTLLFDPQYRVTRKNLARWMLYLVILGAVLLCTGFLQAFSGKFMVAVSAPAQWFAAPQRGAPHAKAALGAEQRLLLEADRFLSGRGSMWIYVPTLMRDNPWGYGVGNALRVMRTRYGYSGGQDVLHNVFLQLLVDEGVPGGLWYLCMVIAYLRGFIHKRMHYLEKPFAGYFLVYLVLSLVQFHGGEALMLFVLGAWLQNGFDVLAIPTQSSRCD